MGILKYLRAVELTLEIIMTYHQSLWSCLRSCSGQVLMEDLGLVEGRPGLAEELALRGWGMMLMVETVEVNMIIMSIKDGCGFGLDIFERDLNYYFSRMSVHRYSDSGFTF